MDGKVVSAMEGWEVLDELVGMLSCGRGMVEVWMDDKGGEVRRERRDLECDGCWGVIEVRVIRWVD